MSPNEMREVAAQVENLMKDDAIRIMGIEGTKHFKKSFQDEGFTDETLQKWEDLKPSTIKNKTRANGSTPGILTNQGHLGDAVDWNADYNGVTFKNDRPYAQVHNEGGTVSKGARSETFVRNRGTNNRFAPGTTAGKGFSFKESSFQMPKRQFMGPSKKLEEKIVEKITKRLDRLMNR